MDYNDATEPEFFAPGQYRFDYIFAEDANTTIPELRERHGQTVTVLGEAESYDRLETGPMYAVKFADGYTNDVFEEELHPLA